MTGLGWTPSASQINTGVDIGLNFLNRGGSDQTSCPGQIPPSLLGSVISHGTAAEQAQWDVLIRGVKPTWYTTLSAVPLDKLSFAIAGGSDCKVTTTPGRALVSFAQQQVQKYAGVALSSSGTLPDSSVYPIEGGPTVNPIIRPLPNEYTTPPDNQSTIDKILAVLKHAAETGLNTAVTTAASGTYGAMTPAQQAEVERQIRQQQQASTLFGLPMPVVLGVAALAGVVLLTRSHR